MLELAPEERSDVLAVELHDGRGTLAAGCIAISTLWEARPHLLSATPGLPLMKAPARGCLACVDLAIEYRQP